MQDKGVNKILIVLIVVALPIMILLFMQNRNLSEILKNEKGLEIGEKAFLFEATAIDGDRVSIASKNTVLVFFNSTCDACEVAAPLWQDLFEKYDSKINMIGISGESEIVTEDFVVNHGLTFPIIVDTDKKIISKYRIKFSPQIFVVDNNGEIIYRSEYATGVKNAMDHVERIIQRINSSVKS